jgi:hypothetical protein
MNFAYEEVYDAAMISDSAYVIEGHGADKFAVRALLHSISSHWSNIGSGDELFTDTFSAMIAMRDRFSATNPFEDIIHATQLVLSQADSIDPRDSDVLSNIVRARLYASTATKTLITVRDWSKFMLLMAPDVRLLVLGNVKKLNVAN